MKTYLLRQLIHLLWPFASKRREPHLKVLYRVDPIRVSRLVTGRLFIRDLGDRTRHEVEDFTAGPFALFRFLPLRLILPFRLLTLLPRFFIPLPPLPVSLLPTVRIFSSALTRPRWSSSLYYFSLGVGEWLETCQ